MSNKSAEILVTKLEAARRLLRSAIRLHFLREDELAVHTVAAAAYGILKDLKKQRGLNEAQFAMETEMLGWLALAKKRVADQLPASFLSDAYSLQFIDWLVKVCQITADTDISKLDFPLVMDSASTAGFWRTNNRASNFLKHADQDSEGALSLNDVNNFQLLMNAMFSYESIAPNDLGFEGVVIQLYFLAENDSKLDLSHPMYTAIAKLRKMGAEERFEYSAFQLNRPRPDSID